MCVCVCVRVSICLCLCVHTRGALIMGSANTLATDRDVPIIGAAKVLATDMLIFTVSVIGTDNQRS